MKKSYPEQIFCFKRWNRKGWSAFASFHRLVMIGVLSVVMSMLLLATQRASAQPADTTVVLRELRIAEVGISGRRSAAVRNVVSQTPLFDRKAQAAAPYQTLESALRTAPSVDIRERGGKGTQADISIRGGSFDQTMVLLNGIDFTDARTGHQSHSLPVDLDCISGIELLDGIPGVGAYAGAVNIRTAPLAARYLRFEASAGSTVMPTATSRGPSRSAALLSRPPFLTGAATVTAIIPISTHTTLSSVPRTRPSRGDCSISRPVISAVRSVPTGSTPFITPSSGSAQRRR